MSLETYQIIYIAIATLIGDSFATMFGGGSFFIQPALLSAGIEPSKAVANDIASAVFAGVAFLWFYRNEPKQIKISDFKTIILWTLPTLILGTIIGSHLLENLSDSIVRYMIICICTLGLIYTLARIKIPPAPKVNPDKNYIPFWKFFTLLAGLCVGFYDGISGAGGGILVILFVTFIFRLDMKTTLAVSNLISVISLACATVSFFFLGLLSVELLIIMIPVCIIAGAVGARIASMLPEKILRIVYSILILSLIIYLLKDSL